MDNATRPAFRAQAAHAAALRADTAFPAQRLFSRQDRDRPEPARVRQALAACPELDCLRSRLPPGILAAAELRAAEIGTAADRVLIASGTVSEEAYLAALADWLGTTFDTLATIPRSACPLPAARFANAATAGILPLVRHGRLYYVVAPRAMNARWLASQPNRSASRIILTTEENLQRFILRHGVFALGRKAAEELATTQPLLSAGTQGKQQIRLCAIAALLIAICSIAMPSFMAAATGIALSLVFIGWAGLRIGAVLTSPLLRRRDSDIPDSQLPIYTIMVALYREKRAVEPLMAALSNLDYPPEKLDIKMVVERSDTETIEALAAVRGGVPFQVFPVPAIGPQTKPKALNAALPFARGTFTAIFDAEDRPDPHQLRQALAAFEHGGERLACVQARLTIDNTRDNWLTRFFTAEYAGLFDVFLPSIAAWRLPLPLGGTSNHFRTDILRRVGAWDPYNVTEDADLGIRLARYGYRTDIVQASTYEEAPARMTAWLRQRTRWFKGWAQTWLVHMRRPLSLWRELGTAGFLTFQLIVGGTMLAALVHPIFVIAFFWNHFLGDATNTDNVYALVENGLHSTTLLAGYLASCVLGAIGLWRRKLLSCAWVFVLTPLYWLLLSLAAWRAVGQLFFDPFHWEKTDHGLARTSRLDAGISDADTDTSPTA